MFGPFALAVAALFTGAAIYISWAEQPARLALDDPWMLAEWKPSYRRGFLMQASLAVIGFILGALEWMVTGHVIWLAGGAVLLANWPFTLLAIMPVNRKLEETPIELANGETRSLIERWGMLHGVRSVFGIFSLGLFLWASI
jgi:hypothetical protein